MKGFLNNKSLRILISASIWLAGFLCIFGAGGQMAHADGKMYSWSMSEDIMRQAEEYGQSAYISYINNQETLLINVNTGKLHNNALWVFPIPADPKNVRLEIIDVLPTFVVGWDLFDQLYDNAGANSPFLYWPLSAVCSPLSIRTFILRSVFSVFFGSEFSDLEQDGITRYESLSKYGITSEVIQAISPEELISYFRQKGLVLDENETLVWKDYFFKNYSFVLSWISDSSVTARALKVTFPTSKIYYPMKPTSSYGQTIIPLSLTVVGYVPKRKSIKSLLNTASDNSINWHIGNSTNNRAELNALNLNNIPDNKHFIYSTLAIKTEARNFTEDLWFSIKSETITSLILFAAFQHVLNSNSSVSLIILCFIAPSLIYYLLVSIIARTKISFKALILFIMCLAIVGLPYAIYLLSRKHLIVPVSSNTDNYPIPSRWWALTLPLGLLDAIIGGLDILKTFITIGQSQALPDGELFRMLLVNYFVFIESPFGSLLMLVGLIINITICLAQIWYFYKQKHPAARFLLISFSIPVCAMLSLFVLLF